VKRAAAVALCATLQADAPPGFTVATGDDAPGSGWAGGWHVKLAGQDRGPYLLTGELADEPRVRAAWGEYTASQALDLVGPAEEHGDPAGAGGAGGE
jgi:hypothetical protein